MSPLVQKADARADIATLNFLCDNKTLFHLMAAFW